MSGTWTKCFPMKKPKKPSETTKGEQSKVFMFSSSPQIVSQDLYDKLRQNPKQFSILSPGFELLPADKPKKFRNDEMPKTPKLKSIRKRENRKLVNSSSSSTSTVLLSPRKSTRMDNMPKTPKLVKRLSGALMRSPKQLPSILQSSRSKSKKIIEFLPSILDSSNTPKLSRNSGGELILPPKLEKSNSISKFTNSLISISKTDSMKNTKKAARDEEFIDPELISKTDEVSTPRRDRKSVDLFDPIVLENTIPLNPGVINKFSTRESPDISERLLNLENQTTPKRENAFDYFTRLDTCGNSCMNKSTVEETSMSRTQNIYNTMPPSDIQSENDFSTHPSQSYVSMRLFDSLKSPEITHPKNDLFDEANSLTQSQDSNQARVRLLVDGELTPTSKKPVYHDVELSSPILIPDESQSLRTGEDIGFDDLGLEISGNFVNDCKSPLFKCKTNVKRLGRVESLDLELCYQEPHQVDEASKFGQRPISNGSNFLIEPEEGYNHNDVAAQQSLLQLEPSRHVIAQSQILDPQPSPLLIFDVKKSGESQNDVDIDLDFQASLIQLPQSQILRERLSSQADIPYEAGSPDYDIFSTQVWRDVVIPSPEVDPPTEFRISNTFTTALGKKVDVDTDLLAFGREIVHEAGESECQRSINDKAMNSVFRPLRLVEMKSVKRKRDFDEPTGSGCTTSHQLSPKLVIPMKNLVKSTSTKIEQFEMALKDYQAFKSEDKNTSDSIGNELCKNTNSNTIQMLGGFTTGAGKALKDPSIASIAKFEGLCKKIGETFKDEAEKSEILDEWNPNHEKQLEESENAAVSKIESFGGFTTGAGKKLDTPSIKSISKFSILDDSIVSTPSHSKLNPAKMPLLALKLHTPFSSTPYSSFRGESAPFKTPVFKKPVETPTSVGLKNTPFKKPKLTVLNPQYIANTPASTSKRNREFKFEGFILLMPEPAFRKSLKDCFITTTYVCDDEWNKLQLEQLCVHKFPDGGYESVHATLLDRGCNANCITLSWTRNHYKWIVHKLACKSRRIASSDITFNNVVQECLYRYQSEVNDCKRSAIKKVLEGDGNPSIHMVLFVSFLQKSQDGWKMKVCDGWYEISCQVDACMTRLIDSGKIFIGLKLHIIGASLLGEGNGVFKSTAVLKFSGNNCRPGKWWGKLGICKPRMFPIRLDSIISDGGIVSCVEFVVNRIFPVMYSEKVPGAHSIVRNSREDSEVAREWNLEHDRVFAVAEKLFNTGKLKFETANVYQELLEYTDERHPPRQVSILYSFQIIDFFRGSRSLLSIYSHSDAEYDHWKEGMRIQMYGVTGNSNHIRSTYKSTHRILKGDSEWYKPRALVSLECLKPGELYDMVIAVVQVAQISSKPRVLRILATDESLLPVLIDFKTNVSVQRGNILMCCNLSTNHGRDDGFRLIIEKYSLVSVENLIKPYLTSDRMKELKSWFSQGYLYAHIRIKFSYLLDENGNLQRL